MCVCGGAFRLLFLTRCLGVCPLPYVSVPGAKPPSKAGRAAQAQTRHGFARGADAPPQETPDRAACRCAAAHSRRACTVQARQPRYVVPAKPAAFRWRLHPQHRARRVRGARPSVVQQGHRATKPQGQGQQHSSRRSQPQLCRESGAALWRCHASSTLATSPGPVAPSDPALQPCARLTKRRLRAPLVLVFPLLRHGALLDVWRATERPARSAPECAPSPFHVCPATEPSLIMVRLFECLSHSGAAAAARALPVCCQPPSTGPPSTC